MGMKLSADNLDRERLACGLVAQDLRPPTSTEIRRRARAIAGDAEPVRRAFGVIGRMERWLISGGSRLSSANARDAARTGCACP